MFLLNNITATLSDKNKTLMFKNGSFLNNINPDEIYRSLGDKLINEISIFKTELFPVLKYFKSSVDNVIRSKTPDEGFVSHKVFTPPLSINNIISFSKIDVKTELYKPITFLKSYDTMIDLDVEDLTQYFVNEKSPITSGALPILETMNTEEIKTFLSEYCTYFYNNGSEEVFRGRKSYRMFGLSGIEAMYHLKELCLLWFFIQVRKVSDDTKSNLPSQDEIISLNSIEKDLEKLIGIGYGYYNEYIKNEIISFEVPETNEGKIKYVNIVDANLPKLIEQSSKSPYEALYGSHSSIVSVFQDKDVMIPKIRTVKDIVENEARYMKYYSDIVKMTSIRNMELFINNLRRQIIMIANETFNLYMTDKLKDYSSSKVSSHFTTQVSKYLENIKDDKLTNDSALLASDIIGRILFDRTYFGTFLDAQTQLDDVVENFDIKEDEEINLWVINFLTRFLVDSLEID